MRSYFSELANHFGAGWNRFWFAPSDPLTLSVLRLLVGGLATITIATFTFDLDRLLGATGLLPLDVVKQLVNQRDLQYELGPVWRFSYFDYAGDDSALWAAHVASLAVMLLFTVGFLSRVTSVAALIVFLSYLHRVPLISSQSEPMLAFLLFYLCFGPTGAYLSVDRWLHRRKLPAEELDARAPASSAATICVRLIQVHLAIVFVMMALAKFYGNVWWNGTAMWWLITNSPARLVDFGFLISHPYVVNFWTHAEIAYELLFPVLVWNRWARPLLLGWGVVMWVLLALVTGLVSYGVVMIIATIAFIEPDQLRTLWTTWTARHPEAAVSP
ncbi:MAG TPA: HTTM domain-containing protein [Pirellulales bacterium]|jgi:hypothetical protein|nr:HTTM domain-containing protein [Pirellulales bacterium]